MKQRKILTVLEVILLILFQVSIFVWVHTAIKNESPAITQTINLMLLGYKHDDAEQVYEQRVSIEQGGRLSLDDIRSTLAGPDLEFELYQSIEVEVLRVIPWLDLLRLRDNEAIARVVLTYENGCQVPFVFVLHQIDGEWKVYRVSYEEMGVSEIRACMRGE